MRYLAERAPEAADRTQLSVSFPANLPWTKPPLAAILSGVDANSPEQNPVPHDHNPWLDSAVVASAGAGFAIMSLEISAARILAPYMGSSAAVWTGIIGVILGSLAYGAMLGGRRADISPLRTTIAGAFLLAAMIIIIVALCSGPVLTVSALVLHDLRSQAVLGTLLLFAAPSALLGAISPLALRLGLTDVSRAGGIAGRLSAAGTLGSLAGTFLTGFYLLHIMGSRRLLLAIAVLCGLLSIYVAKEEQIRQKLSVLFVAVLLLVLPAFSQEKFLGLETVKDLDTLYQRALVVDVEQRSTKRPMRALITDPSGYQSVIYRDAPAELVHGYLTYFDLAFRLKPDATRALLVGGGAFSYPKHIQQTRPDLSLDIIELDPEIAAIARELFFFRAGAKTRIFFGDARVEVPKREEQYDALFVDAFGSSPTIPFHLVTEEAVAAYAARLAPDGVFMLNLIAGTAGPIGGITRSIVKTLHRSFAQVETFCVHEEGCDKKAHNILIVGLKHTRPFPWDTGEAELQKLFTRRVELGIGDNDPVLTDDYAPVEYLMLPVIRSLTDRSA